MKSIHLLIFAGAIALSPAAALAQHTAPGAPLLHGQPQHPDTTVAPRGSAPSGVAPGDVMSMSASELSGLPVVNQFGEPVGTVDRAVQGDGGLIYVVVSLDDGRPVIFPIMLMGAHEDQLVVQGYGGDILRAQTLEPTALEGFSRVHSAELVEIPNVTLAQQ